MNGKTSCRGKKNPCLNKLNEILKCNRVLRHLLHLLDFAFNKYAKDIQMLQPWNEQRFITALFFFSFVQNSYTSFPICGSPKPIPFHSSQLATVSIETIKKGDEYFSSWINFDFVLQNVVMCLQLCTYKAINNVHIWKKSERKKNSLDTSISLL